MNRYFAIPNLQASRCSSCCSSRATAAAPFLLRPAVGRPADGDAALSIGTPPPPAERAIEAVFVLDTTGSMSGPARGREAQDLVDRRRHGRQPARRPGPHRPRRLPRPRRRLRDAPRRPDRGSRRRLGRAARAPAEGGGDTPESVNQALHEAVDGHRAGARAAGVYRVVFLVGDAPPHLDYPQDVGLPRERRRWRRAATSSSTPSSVEACPTPRRSGRRSRASASASSRRSARTARCWRCTRPRTSELAELNRPPRRDGDPLR